MKARVIATGEIIEVKVYKREYGLYIRIDGEKRGEIYRAYELDFDINEKFAENCLNGIKQGIDYTTDYWTRLEHQYAGMAMQGLLAHEGTEFRNYLLQEAMDIAHELVEKLKEK